MKPIHPIGYEASSPADFDQALADAGVEVVVDVRAVALSRRAGFSKTALSARLKAQGLEYLHLRGLGDPKEGREAARAGDYDRFVAVFSAHMQTSVAQADLSQLVLLAQTQRVALLCYEADPTACHRSIVARELARIGQSGIDHLRVEVGAGDRRGGRGADDYPGQGCATA